MFAFQSEHILSRCAARQRKHEEHALLFSHVRILFAFIKSYN